MRSSSRRLLAGTILGVSVSLAAVACTAAPSGSSSTPPTIQHIHDIAFSSNSELLVGSHHGVYAVDLDTGDTALVGGVEFDAMGLAAQGENIFVSGHPGKDNHDSFAAPNVGLVKHHSETGWQQVSLAGTTDFHNLSTTPANPDFIVGLPSDRAVLLRSTDAGRTFTEASALSARDVSIDSGDPNVLTATTAEGLVVSRDGGDTFTPLAGPTLVVIAPDPTRDGGIVGIAPDGELWFGSTDIDAEWTSAGIVEGGAGAVVVSDDGAIAVAGESSVVITRDGGATWTTVI
ncbi:hypothetical protein FB472_1138 [Rhodoglobus vestalii]|uniref:BNR/Asp-box repeat protein n=1 Tax=Rhodoglobus vestalii TaxID=193384 RepID=A0A8H2K8F0_9MICO|nr:hypothetical protein [Rhodoglobus vestalii]TQO19571.1 hypothetical protein FB472_1138 [Rhodoglobus vestalii]